MSQVKLYSDGSDFKAYPSASKELKCLRVQKCLRVNSWLKVVSLFLSVKCRISRSSSDQHLRWSGSLYLFSPSRLGVVGGHWELVVGHKFSTARENKKSWAAGPLIDGADQGTQVFGLWRLIHSIVSLFSVILLPFFPQKIMMKKDVCFDCVRWRSATLPNELSLCILQR
jgi:hypothetical protein